MENIGIPSKINRIIKIAWKERQLWAICIPMIIWVLTFAYYPMYGLTMSFVNYIPGREIYESQWVGLQWFKEFFTSPDFNIVLRNTLAISGLRILLGFPAPIIFAVLLNELKDGSFKKVTQTISYLPHFISWVVAASLIYTFLSTDGLLNDVLLRLNLIEKPISYIGEGKYFWLMITVANMWKSVGWSSIIYLSAIAGISKELYEAGNVDGLNRFGQIWHITLPGIRPTIILLWILSIGNLLNAGFEQQLLLGNDQTREYWDVIDTYVYRYGIQLGRYSFGTAVGLLKGIIGLSLVMLTNRISRKIFDISII